MNSLVVLAPRCPATLTEGRDYDGQMIDGLRERGWAVVVHELEGGFPHPTPAARGDAARVLSAIPDRSTVLIDGLALGAMPDEALREAHRLRLVALVHQPLAAETGLEPHIVRRLEANERRALAAVRLVVATSHATADGLAHYGVRPDRIQVVEPGTDRAPLARGSQESVRNLLCVATLAPRKGHDILFRSLAEIRGTDWRLTCVGSLNRSPTTVQRLREQLELDGLEDQVQLVGEADPTTVAGLYDTADVFVLPTLHEAYGMAVAEALARGLPVISTPTGAIAELVGRDAGVLVPPGDADALTAALWRVLVDDDLRARFREGAKRVRGRLPTWEEQSGRMADALSA